MSPAPKVLNHPDKEDIIAWITQGVSVREVERRLAEKYPRKNQQHLRIAFSTIQSFKKNHLDLKGKMLSDIKEIKKNSDKITEEALKQQDIEGTLSYQDAIKKLAVDELDTRKEILKVWVIIEKQIEMLFDKLNESVGFVDKDVHKVMQGYLNQFMSIIDQYKKYEEGYRESVDVNVNVNVMSDQIQIMREALRETLSETDPEITMIFMGKLNEKMKDLTFKGDEGVSKKHSMLLDAALGSKIEEVNFE